MPLTAIERDNPALKDVLPKDYARPALDKTRLGEVVDLVSNIRVGGAEARATDVLGNVYEYFLEQFAIGRGQEGWRVLHPSQCRTPPGGDAGTLPGSGLRPLLRLRGDVRPVHGIHSGPRHGER